MKPGTPPESASSADGADGRGKARHTAPRHEGSSDRPEKWSAAELAEVVNTWCRLRGIEPVSGQAAPELTERIVRFYRTQGIIDPPQSGGTGAGRAGFGRKHRLQLNLLRLLQAEGTPLRRIQELLYGRTEDELAALERHATRPGASLLPRSAVAPAAAVLADSPAALAEQISQPAATQHVTPGRDASAAGAPAVSAEYPAWRIGSDFVLLPLSNRRLTEAERSAIAAILFPSPSGPPAMGAPAS
ncbi:hypothetical protein DB346_03200 [Verrucomicrobia bacterium LW23]|nr:hypothetical protein DB346_03200 [Verrucomicrobia bacterium LW23]